MQAKEDMAFLKRLVEVNELFGPGIGGVHLSKEVLLNSLSSDASSVTFHVPLPKGALKSRQPILPHGNGAFPASQLPPLSKELPLHLNNHCIRRRQSPTPTNKQRLVSRQEASPGKHRHGVKSSPDQWRCPTGGGILFCLMGRRLVAIVAGAPTTRMLVMLSPTSHHGQ
jgi:hypothetical protein